MEGDTEALASAAVADRADRARAPALRRARHRRDPGAAGRHAGRRRSPMRRPPPSWGSTRSASSTTSPAMQERGLLRRVAAILYHRRAGFSANGMGVWKVPEEQILDIGRRMAAVRGISHCYQRPTYADWPYSVFTMAHGRSKEECDAILDSIAEQTGISERATLYSSTEFKKIRLLYFTDEFKDWEREHAGVCRSRTVTGDAAPRRLTDSRARPSSTARALRAAPGRRQLARARDARDRPRPAVRRARRGRRAGRRRRQPLRRLRLLVGSVDPRPRPPARCWRPSTRRPRAARASARRPPARSSSPPRSARAWRRGDAAHDLLGHGGDDDARCASRARPPAASGSSSSRAPTTATSTACSRRPAPAWRRRRCPPAPACRPRPPRTRSSCRGTTRDALLAADRASTRSAAILAEPLPANMGLVPAASGFLELLRERADASGALLSSTR